MEDQSFVPVVPLALSWHLPQSSSNTNTKIEPGRESYLAFGGVPPVAMTMLAGEDADQNMEMMQNWPEGTQRKRPV